METTVESTVNMGKSTASMVGSTGNMGMSTEVSMGKKIMVMKVLTLLMMLMMLMTILGEDYLLIDFHNNQRMCLLQRILKKS